MPAPPSLPDRETQLRLTAAAKLLIDAAVGNTLSVPAAIDGARQILDRALDAEIGALAIPLRTEEAP